jgi:hypothetical protein
MHIAELLPKIHGMTRADKVRILHFITSELSAEEQPTLLPGSEYPVWTPLGEERAAADLLDFLVRSNPRQK